MAAGLFPTGLAPTGLAPAAAGSGFDAALMAAMSGMGTAIIISKAGAVASGLTPNELINN